MSFQRQSAVLVDAKDGALCTKEGFKLIASGANYPLITFANGTTQGTAAVTKDVLFSTQTVVGGSTPAQVNGSGLFNYVDSVTGSTTIDWSATPLLGGEQGKNYVMTVQTSMGTAAPTAIQPGETCIVDLAVALNFNTPTGPQTIGGYPGFGGAAVNGVKESTSYFFDAVLSIPANWSLVSYNASVVLSSANTTLNANIINVNDLSLTFYGT